MGKTTRDDWRRSGKQSMLGLMMEREQAKSEERRKQGWPLTSAVRDLLGGLLLFCLIPRRVVSN